MKSLAGSASGSQEFTLADYKFTEQPVDIIKLYIVQCITNSANNLRLNSERIQMLTSLRAFFMEPVPLELSIAEMKKVTELSTFAIRIGEMFKFLISGKVDFLRMSEVFRKHSTELVTVLNVLLQRTSSAQLAQLLERVRKNVSENAEFHTASSPIAGSFAKASSAEISSEIFRGASKDKQQDDFAAGSDVIEAISSRFNGDAENREFPEDLRQQILSAIKNVDEFFNRLEGGVAELNEYNETIEIMEKNAEICLNEGFELVGKMHANIAQAIYLIGNNQLNADHSVMESLRACLIVIVVTVKNKNVDITGYLFKAGKFGEEIAGL